MRLACLLALAGLTAGCAPPTPEQVAARCEERARAAQAPEVDLRIGANSDSGGFASASIGLSADFLRGRDPLEVYETCVMELTGAPPIRPPRLRAI